MLSHTEIINISEPHYWGLRVLHKKAIHIHIVPDIQK